MVAAVARHETIFTVLGDSARHRAERALNLQLGVCLALAIVLAARFPAWWPATALLVSSCLYAAWGLVAHRLARSGNTARKWHRYVSVVIAAAASFAAAVGLIGLALVAFTGTGRSPYTPCGPGAKSAFCQAMEHPASGPKLPIR
jgi:hypothetical protein